jgi:hypothetical protein
MIRSAFVRLLAAALIAVAPTSYAQLYPYFGPSNGIMKGSTSTPQTSAATSTDVIGLFSGSCTASTFVRGDGSCQIVAGGITGLANPTGTIGLSAVNGSATTALRSDGAPALSQGISPTWTGTHMFAGGIIGGVTTAGVNIGQSAGAAVFRFVDTTGPANGKAWQFNTSTTGTVFNMGAISDDFSTTFRNFLTATRSAGSIANLSFGNPTDSPTYNFNGTGTATFGGAVSVSGGGSLLKGPVTVSVPTSGNPLTVVTTTGAFGSSASTVSDGVNYTIALGRSGTTGSVGYVGGASGSQLDIGASGTAWARLNTSGNWTFNTPSSGAAVTVNASGASPALTLNGAGATQLTALQLQQSGQSAWQLYQAASSSTLHLWNGSSGDVMTVTNAGNVGVNAASSGSSLTVNQANGNASPTLQLSGPASTAVSLGISQTSGGNWQIYNPAGSTSLRLYDGSGDRVIFNTGGGATFNAPTSGTTVTANGLAGQYGVVVNGSSTASQSLGARVFAGTNSSDFNLALTNQTGTTNFMLVHGDGGIEVGSPTGGDKGAGTINAQNLYVNGVAVGGGGVTQTSGNTSITTTSGCTVNQSMTVNWVVTGKQVTVSYPGVACTASGTSGLAFTLNGLPAAIRPTTQGTSVVMVVDNGTAKAATGAIDSGGTLNILTGAGSFSGTGTFTLSRGTISYDTDN